MVIHVFMVYVITKHLNIAFTAASSSFGFARNQQSSFGGQEPSSQYGQPQLGAQSPSTQYGQHRFGAQSPSTQYGQPQFGVQANQHSQPIGAPSHQFGSQSQAQYRSNSQYNQPQFAPSGPSVGSDGARFTQYQSAASRQYLAPKTQDIPQQPFDEQTGYQY